MKLPLWSCTACQSSDVSQRTFPLCSQCRSSLQDESPELCKNCASPLCPPVAECLRPWRKDPAIDAYFARYLAFGRSHEVLKAWKKRGGPIFDQVVLRSDASLVEQIRKRRPSIVTPIPQKWRRSYALGRSPAEQLAEWIGSKIGVPVRSVLEVSQTTAQGTSQQFQRFSMQVDFRSKENQLPANILLVDDWMTSGHTLIQAATLLKRGGAQQVDGFVLGLRLFAQRV